MNYAQEIEKLEDQHMRYGASYDPLFDEILELAEKMQEELSEAQKYITILETRLCCYGEFTDH